MRYLTHMIESIRHKGLRKFFEDNDSSKLHGSADKIRRLLLALDAASKPEAMNVPGFKFHQLQGKPQRYAVTVTANWRITFGWNGENAVDVDYEDYH